MAEQVRDALGEGGDVAAAARSAGVAVCQRQLDVFGVEGDDGFAQRERLEDGDADEALEHAWLDVDVGGGEQAGHIVADAGEHDALADVLAAGVRLQVGSRSPSPMTRKRAARPRRATSAAASMNSSWLLRGCSAPMVETIARRLGEAELAAHGQAVLGLTR